MKNLVQGRGTTVQWVNDVSADKVTGDVVLIGDQGLAGSCVESIADGETGTVLLPPGIVTEESVKGDNGSTGTAVAIGDKVYYTEGEAFIDVDSAQALVGYSLEAVSSGGTASADVFRTLS